MGDEDKKFENVFKAFGTYAETVGKAFATNFMATEIDKTIKQYETSAVNVLKTFGTGRDRIVELKASMADAVTSVKLLGGEFTDVANIAEGIGKSLNRNMILTSDSYAKLFATTQVTGQSVAELGKGFKDAGYSIYQIEQNMQKVVDVARAQGINTKTVSREVVDNMGLMDKYNFAGGVEGLAKMVTQATSLRISVRDISGAMEKAFNPESAIDMAARLQSLGMAQSDLLDPLRLMDLAQNDPAELQNQIAEMSKTFVEFNQQTKSFEISPGAKRQLKEVADALNMTPEAFAKMAKSAAEMDDKLSKISFPDTFSEEQKKFVANMAEMGEGGEYMLRVDNKDLKLDEAMKLFEGDSKKLEKFMKESQPKSMEQLASEQLTTSQRMAANVNAIANRMGAAVASSESQEMANQASIQLSEAIPKILSGEKLQVQGMREFGDKMAQDLIKDAQSGKLVEGLGKAEKAQENYFTGALDDMSTGVQTAFKGLSESSNPLIKITSDLAGKMGDLVIENEKLDKSYFKLSETTKSTSGTLGKTTEEKGKTTTTATFTPPKTTEALDKVKEPPRITEPKSTEMKFTEPLKIEFSFSNLPAGLNSEDFKKMLNEDKVSQELYDAFKRAELQRTQQK
jgi:hypothetical protein